MDTSTCVISLEDTPRPEDVATVIKGLEAYNLNYAPADGYRPLCVFLRTREQAVVGGLIGNTYWGWLNVERLWIDEGQRRQDYGQQILAAAEHEALRRDCRHVHLDTLSFQALPFYERQGYTVWGVLEDLPPGHKRYFLKKDLVPQDEGEKYKPGAIQSTNDKQINEWLPPRLPWSYSPKNLFTTTMMAHTIRLFVNIFVDGFQIERKGNASHWTTI